MIWGVFNAFQKLAVEGRGLFHAFRCPFAGTRRDMSALWDGVCVQGNDGDFAELECGQLLLTGAARSCA